MEKNEYEASVMEFMTKFETSRDPALWDKLITEEAEEVVEAFNNLMKEFADLAYVIQGYLLSGGDEDVENTALKRADRVIDFCSDIPDEVMVEAFRRVHKSNMSKLGDDGKPIKREDGKILKGPNYKAPDMSDITTY